MLKKTSSKLYLLVFVFIVGFLSLFILNQVFLSLVSEQDEKTKNYKSKILIGEYISEDILNTRALFFELASTTTSVKSRDIIIDQIEDKMDDITVSLNVLEHGGILKRFIKLNVVGHKNTIKRVEYNVRSANELSFEAIEVKPKLIELEDMIQEVNELLRLRSKYKKEKKIKEFSRIVKKIRRFYKTTPAFFTRMTENIKRLLYESDIELAKLTIEIKKKKSKYIKIKMALILLVIVIVVLIASWIGNIISKENEELASANDKFAKAEASIKGILDAQPNIIIVSDGKEMLDANLALVDFFEDYSSFEQFKNKHACICDFFEKDTPGDEYIVKKDYDGESWINYLLNNADKNFKVIMKKKDKEIHHFSMQARKKIIDSSGAFIIVLSLNDITAEIDSQLNLLNLNDNLESMVEYKTKELQELNENLEQKVIIETQKVREKDKQMTQQARFAALGEMIGNIAHQWRQPLSAINTTASGMKIQIQLGITNDEEIDDSFGKIMGYVDFLTQTIEDFRGFFKEDKEKINFNVIDPLAKTISITSAIYKDNNIELINDCVNDEKFISNGMPSELSQVFLNVLNNAKDATNDNKIESRFVHISSAVENGFNVVYIQDNAGGIPDAIIDKIFDPYFTTKHQSQGTGIGLYMSKEIIEKHMNGSIEVKNKTIKYDGILYNGACFRIALPAQS